MSIHSLAAGAMLAAAAAGGQTWRPVTSGPAVSLRGISAVNGEVAFASGAQGTILRTTDGGLTWRYVGPPGAGDVDFRDIEAINERIVYAMSAGEGPLSRIYKSADGGERWTLARVNGERGFWDAIEFWDEDHGILIGDPVDGRFTVLTTSDGGRSWQASEGPKAERGEAAFAASGSCLFVRGTREAWFASGGPGGARVFHSEDGGATWSAAETPVRADADGAGIFSLAFAANGRDGIAVGGDYTKPDDGMANWAVTRDGGRSWTTPPGGPRGYRSAVAYAARLGIWVAAGTSGSEWSRDGRRFEAIDGEGYNALSFATDGAGWAVGSEGRMARFVFSVP